MKKEHFEIPKAPITPYRFYFLKLDLIRKIYISPVVELTAEPKGEEKQRNDNRLIGLPQDRKGQFDLYRVEFQVQEIQYPKFSSRSRTSLRRKQSICKQSRTSLDVT
jgi:hypothetical protein